MTKKKYLGLSGHPVDPMKGDIRQALKNRTQDLCYHFGIDINQIDAERRLLYALLLTEDKGSYVERKAKEIINKNAGGSPSRIKPERQEELTLEIDRRRDLGHSVAQACKAMTNRKAPFEGFSAGTLQSTYYNVRQSLYNQKTWEEVPKLCDCDTSCFTQETFEKTELPDLPRLCRKGTGCRFYDKIEKNFNILRQMNAHAKKVKKHLARNLAKYQRILDWAIPAGSKKN